MMNAMGLRRSIVLASSSPRRRALLEAALFTVEVCAPDVNEIWPGGDPGDATIQLAHQKLDAVEFRDSLMLAADTAVIRDGVALGKPSDRGHAIDMLMSLAGREHLVITGFCLRKNKQVYHQAIETRVTFRALSRDEIEAYVDSGEPMDKAGAYGIQGLGGALVDSLQGSYTNVIGLPLRQVIEAVGSFA